MHTKTNSNIKTDLHIRITDEIVSAIEEGAVDFEMPWHKNASAGLPRNPVTKNCYRGVNILSLWMSGRKQGFASSQWASYLQWKSLGAQVRKGEKGAIVVFYKREEESPDDEEKKTSRPLLRHSFVFNADQVDGCTASMSTFYGVDQGTFTAADIFIDALGSDVRFGSDTAYYSPLLDRIFMPNRAEFYDNKHGSALEGFYAVYLHEHVHWSGHPSRLNRDLSGRFGTESYAMEELIAELGAAFLCASLGINTYPRSDHAAYMASWLKVLKEQQSAIFVAARMASIANQFLDELAAEHK